MHRRARGPLMHIKMEVDRESMKRLAQDDPLGRDGGWRCRRQNLVCYFMIRDGFFYEKQLIAYMLFKCVVPRAAATTNPLIGSHGVPLGGLGGTDERRKGSVDNHAVRRARFSGVDREGAPPRPQHAL